MVNTLMTTTFLIPAVRPDEALRMPHLQTLNVSIAADQGLLLPYKSHTLRQILGLVTLQSCPRLFSRQCRQYDSVEVI
jgi:hypothetical protein